MRQFLLFLLLFLSPALAEIPGQEAIATDPPLPQSIPFDQRPDGVGLKYAVLINSSTIVPTTAILRVIYVPPRGDDIDEKPSVERNPVDKMMLQNAQEATVKPKFTPEQAAARKVAEETVWSTIQAFQVALLNLRSQDLHLVFKKLGEKKFSDEPIDLPQGLLLAEEEKITVLAVQKGSAAANAKFQVGDQILKIGDQPVEGTLQSFINLYYDSKKAAETSMTRHLSFLVKGADGTETTKEIKLPPSLSGSFLDMPIQQDSSSRKDPSYSP